MSTIAGPPILLNSNDIDGVVEYMKSDQCKNIVVMAGAGISTSAGIPDFRSPGTGLYSNLAKLKLPYPEAVFEINFFRKNPKPFYMLAHELAPGRFRPTITHSFIKLLADKEKLSVCFTQNIDTLERRAGVPPKRIIEAHGSFASQRCVDCKHPFPDDLMARHIADKTIPRCSRTQVCKGLVKPDIVFFGESLPPAFMNGMGHMRKADLLFIMGTSLTVHPFASLADMVDCPRVLLNMDPAGDIGSEPDDVLVLAKCDDAVRRIAAGMGWLEELEAEWAKTELKKAGNTGDNGSDAALQKEVDKITANVEKVLSKEDAPKAAAPDVDDVVADLEKLGVQDREDFLTIPPPKTTPSPTVPGDEAATELVTESK
ncbi:NAD-dependent deacetylase sirtuin-2 [Exidia glandulosa HHB12029]|uniref:NAD-dependent protein deacetylase n=1 Tax=Exidia glandulosa HHB12029 TaxID=1314781 RepID=A0A165HPE9_EXIGL|nr:NAD-dependent deacetylase sirtuin-2 [Exidia glandulosa HHB12029]